jgi:hypothetical protein
MCDVLLLGSVPHLEKRETIVLFLHIVVREVHILSEHGLIVMSFILFTPEQRLSKSEQPQKNKYVYNIESYPDCSRGNTTCTQSMARQEY